MGRLGLIPFYISFVYIILFAIRAILKSTQLPFALERLSKGKTLSLDLLIEVTLPKKLFLHPIKVTERKSTHVFWLSAIFIYFFTILWHFFEQWDLFPLRFSFFTTFDVFA